MYSDHTGTTGIKRAMAHTVSVSLILGNFASNAHRDHFLFLVKIRLCFSNITGKHGFLCKLIIPPKHSDVNTKGS